MANITAMVIEDDRTLANLYARMLSSLGLHPEICRDGSLARSRIAEGLAPQFLMLDLFLPHIDGESLLKDIEDNPEFAHTRIIIVTAYPDWGARLMEGHPRVRRVLTKPLELADIKEEIGSLN